MNHSLAGAGRRVSLASSDTNHNYQDLYSGLVRLHILHHACKGEIFGLWMIEELGRHGYRLSPGTLYPILHSLEERGLLVSREKQDGKLYRKFYRATPAGRNALVSARQKVRELFGELFEHKHRVRSPKKLAKVHR